MDNTHDPLFVRFLDADMFVDLGAERLIAAEKRDEKIAVEIKSFLGSSPLAEFHEALGQFMDYRIALENQEPERTLSCGAIGYLRGIFHVTVWSICYSTVPAQIDCV